MAAAAPTIDELRERLTNFQLGLRLCDQIDSWPAVLRCRAQHQRHIDQLTAEIASREAAAA